MAGSYEHVNKSSGSVREEELLEQLLASEKGLCSQKLVKMFSVTMRFCGTETRELDTNCNKRTTILEI